MRLLAHGTGEALDTWSGPKTVAAANESGEVAVTLRGGTVIFLSVVGVEGSGRQRLQKISEKQMDQE